MSNHNRPKVSEVIRSVIGNRIVQDDSPSKLCKDSRIRKNVCTEQYQMFGFKLNGLDGHIHSGDHTYYQNYSYDIKNLQKKLCDALKEAGYDAEYVILQPAVGEKHWSLSFTVTTIEDMPIIIEHKTQHAVCVSKINLKLNNL